MWVCFQMSIFVLVPSEWSSGKEGQTGKEAGLIKHASASTKTLSSLRKVGCSLFLDWPKGNKQVSPCPDVSFTGLKFFRMGIIVFFGGWACTSDLFSKQSGACTAAVSGAGAHLVVTSSGVRSWVMPGWGPEDCGDRRIEERSGKYKLHKHI